jgi:hypothetical protein
VLKPAEFFALLLVILVSLAVNAISAPAFKDEAVAEYEKIGDITVYCCYPPPRDKYVPDLWSETYERDLTDIFAVQSEIAQVVVTELNSRLALERRRTSKHRRMTLTFRPAFSELCSMVSLSVIPPGFAGVSSSLAWHCCWRIRNPSLAGRLSVE